MWIFLHSLVLIAVPVVTLLMVLVQAGRDRRLGVALLTAALALGIQALVYYYYADPRDPEQNPLNQFLVLGGSTLVALLLLNSGRARGLLFLIYTLALIMLCQQYVVLVQGPRWSGLPRSRVERELPRVQEYLVAQGFKDDGVYPAGRVRDLPIAESLPGWFSALLEHPDLDAVHIARWHSWLTRLYRVQRVPRDLVFPGGTLKQGGERVLLTEVGEADLAPASQPTAPPPDQPAAPAPGP